MTDVKASRLGMTVVCLALLLILCGALWYGLSTEVLQRQWNDLTDRFGGPMSFRFVLQPTMAVIAALHDGIRDAQLNRTPYFWTIVNEPEERGERLREGLTATARIILLGLAMDAIYQFKVLGTFYPGEALIIAIALAFIPYLLLRGPIARIARHWFGAPADKH